MSRRDRYHDAVVHESFIGPSEVHDLEVALGQYVLYRSLLEDQEPDRTLYLAVPQFAHNDVFSDKFGDFVIRKHQLRLIVFNDDEEIVQWLP